MTPGSCTGFDTPALKRLSGVHRVQRVPASAKHGRRHSSIVTVAVVEAATEGFRLDRGRVREDRFRASGNGGQNRNKVETAIRLTDLDSGLVVTATEERSQHQNRQVAWSRLEATLRERYDADRDADRNAQRIGSAGAGGAMRTFTWTAWRDRVVGPDGRKARYEAALTGRLGPLL